MHDQALGFLSELEDLWGNDDMNPYWVAIRKKSTDHLDAYNDPGPELRKAFNKNFTKENKFPELQGI